ncbi:MAG TPA: XamI family restriction endonuclease [Candidatus Saccharimonadales bacterium]|nr:XamI family restriction endonuclease [Candidatus Saccharimonadales bacterium]
MAINLDKIQQWKEDVAKSVDFYNNWFLKFAPQTYKETRANTADKVLEALELSHYFAHISPDNLKENPSILAILRMTTRPPIARDRLIGLSGVSPNLVSSMEKGVLPTRMDSAVLDEQLGRISAVFEQLADTELFPWLLEKRVPAQGEKDLAAVIVADRLCGMVADPIIRNAQEQRQLEKIGSWLDSKGYKQRKSGQTATIDTLEAGTYSFRFNVPVIIGTDEHRVNIPVDVAIRPKDTSRKPILIEAKSAGDFTNTNKRRKEEAVKYSQLKSTYGDDIPFLLFLCGYFDSGYLGYEAAEGIDWIWEHRMGDLEALNL